MSVGNPTINRMSTEMSGANHLMFPAAAGIASALKDARRCQWPHRSVAAAVAARILRKLLYSRSATISGARSGREVPLPPRSLSLFDYDDRGSVRPKIMSAIEIGSSGARAGNRMHFSSSRCNSSPASRYWRMPRLRNRQWLRPAACAVRAPGAGGCTPCGRGPAHEPEMAPVVPPAFPVGRAAQESEGPDRSARQGRIAEAACRRG